MAAQTLQTNIVIDAYTRNGFSAAGATLTEMGSIVDGISEKLITFGKESTRVYREYEKSMKDSEIALATIYGKNTNELSDVMGKLDSAATQWSATTKFHTNDVANAISEAAHAGWDLDKIMSGIPAAIKLAQAGGLDLSDSVDYIIKSTNAAGVSFDNLTHFTDLWALAANSSASTIGEFGDAMLQMGASMKFAENPEELMTIIATMADSGMVGSQAGTMIRSSLMRLIAPTQKAKKAMAELGATSDETSALLNDEALAAANAELAAHGFSMYDKDGNMKSVLDTYRGLYVALGDIAGGFDKISQNEDAMDILGAIFPTRTITAALTMLQGVEDQYDGLYEKMINGEADGYTEYAAETALDSLDGRIEIFESKVERLQQLTGSALSGQLSSLLEWAGTKIDSISELPEEQFHTLVSGLEIVAGAGPGLFAAGNALRFIGRMLTPVGAATTGLVALTGAIAVINEMERGKLEDAFGTMDLDDQAILQYADSLGEGFKTAYDEIDKYRQEVTESVDAYKTASQSLSSELFTDMLTGAELSEADKKRLLQYGEDMQSALMSGLSSNSNAQISYWEMLFGDGSAEDQDTLSEIGGLIAASYDDAVAEAEEAGETLKKALTKAFSDGKIDPEEYDNILATFNDLNDKIAQAEQEAQERQDKIEFRALMHKAQTASLDEIEALEKEFAEKRDELLERENDGYYTNYASLEQAYDEAIANGTEINGKKATEEDKKKALKSADNAHEKRTNEIHARYDEEMYTARESLIEQSDYGDLAKAVQREADLVSNGYKSIESASQTIAEEFGGSNGLASGETSFFWQSKDRENLSKMTADEIAHLGGYDAIDNMIDYYNKEGKTTEASNLRNLLARELILNNGSLVTMADPGGLIGTVNKALGNEHVYESNNYDPRLQGIRSEVTGTVDSDAFSTETARQAIESFGDAGKTYFETIGKEAEGKNEPGDLAAMVMQMSDSYRSDIAGIIAQLGENYDLNAVLRDTGNGEAIAQYGSDFQQDYSAYSLLYGEASQNAEQYRIQVTPEIDYSALQNQPPVPLAITPHAEGEDSVSALQNQGVDVRVDGDTEQLNAKIEAEDGQNLLSYVDGDATDLHMSIMDENGHPLEENVTGNPASLESIINSYNGRTIMVNIQGNRLFASGGRATTASIFGEAGPEWAIPEQHSERTAALLNAAREASGFTWSEILSRYGGLNAGASGGSSTLVYSPTIHANDASGVEQVLQNDKEQMERWWRDKKLKDEVEVYA